MSEEKSVEVVENELEVLLPEKVIRRVANEDVEIHRIKVKQLNLVMKSAAPFYHRLSAMKKELEAQKRKLLKGELTSVETPTLDLYGLVCEYGDSLVDIIAILTDKPLAWVEELDLEETAILFEAIIEVNLDFFIQRVLPLLSGLVEGLKGVSVKKV